VSSGVAWARRRRRLDPRALLARHGRPSHVVKVNLGSSLNVAPGWLNIDSSVIALLTCCPSPLLRRLAGASAVAGDIGADEFVATLRGNVFVHHDLRHGIPLVDASVDVVYSSHFLEHLSRSQGLALLDECRRVLRPGGLLRVTVPDAEPAIRALSDGRVEEGLDGLFMDGGTHEAHYHHYGYTEPLLRARLEQAGFVDVRRYACGEGETPELDVLDNRADGTLFMEARRTR
jgi:predicted SAM-dependent methyltransferase